MLNPSAFSRGIPQHCCKEDASLCRFWLFALNVCIILCFMLLLKAMDLYHFLRKKKTPYFRFVKKSVLLKKIAVLQNWQWQHWDKKGKMDFKLKWQTCLFLALISAHILQGLMDTNQVTTIWRTARQQSQQVFLSSSYCLCRDTHGALVSVWGSSGFSAFLPTSHKHASRRLAWLAEKVCVCAALQWTGIPPKMYSPVFPGLTPDPA